MDVGVYVDAHLGIAEQARAIEAAGFSHLWVYDSPLVFGEPYLALLEAARATERITIGPGVTLPGARPAFATAQALGSLATVAPGRLALGIGIGNSARWSLGMRPATLASLHEYLEAVAGLLAGESVEYRESDVSRPIRFIHPEGRWLDLSHPIGIWVSAFGPRGQALAGANPHVDAVFVRWQGEAAIAEVRARIGERTRIATVFAVYPVEDEAELETDEARAALGPLVISRLRYLTANHASAAEVPEPFRDGFDAYLRHRESLDEPTRHLQNYEGYLVSVPPYLEDFVTPASMRTVCFVGTADEVAAELQRMAAAGVHHASLQMPGPPPRWCRRMGEGVLPRLR